MTKQSSDSDELRSQVRYSTNPNTGEQYPLPLDLSDSGSIDDFLSKNADKKVVVVQGLGFVGSVMSLVCANSLSNDYAVIGVDLPTPESYWRIHSLNKGVFPLQADDPKIDTFFENSKRKGNFLATYDPEAYAKADVIIVDINLDVSKKDGDRENQPWFDVDLRGFKKAIQSIGKHCKPDALILVETTVPPGTCQKVVLPLLKEELSKRGLSNELLAVGHSYERVMPGPDYIDSIRTFPRVFAGTDQKSATRVEAFLNTIIDTEVCPLTELNSTNATEMAKVLENSYRAMNISFVVEWSRFAEEAGVDLYAVVNAIRQRSTHANLMFPGIGVGGYCLTKDPLLASWARQNLFDSTESLKSSESAVIINDKMPDYAFTYMQSQFGSVNNKKVLLLGVSYRGDVGDTRFSPVDRFYDRAIAGGGNVSLHDPYVPIWSEKNQTVESDLQASLSSNPEIIVITTGHKIYSQQSTVNALMSCDSLKILDTIGVFSQTQIHELHSKHNLKILGRGDL